MKTALAALAIFASLAAAMPVYAADDGMPQTTCPIMGGAVNKDLYVDHDGKRLYVCCEGCLDAAKKDPGQYIKKLEAEGVTLAPAPKPQTTCPVMGGAVNKNLYVDHKGKRLYVCCEGCLGKAKKDPGQYIKKLEAEGITLALTPGRQRTCPVTGEPVNKNLYVDHNGKRLYVCCEGCLPKAKADPEALIKKLESQGIQLDIVPDTKVRK